MSRYTISLEFRYHHIQSRSNPHCSLYHSLNQLPYLAPQPQARLQEEQLCDHHDEQRTHSPSPGLIISEYSAPTVSARGHCRMLPRFPFHTSTISKRCDNGEHAFRSTAFQRAWCTRDQWAWRFFLNFGLFNFRPLISTLLFYHNTAPWNVAPATSK